MHQILGDIIFLLIYIYRDEFSYDQAKINDKDPDVEMIGDRDEEKMITMHISLMICLIIIYFIYIHTNVSIYFEMANLRSM